MWEFYLNFIAHFALKTLLVVLQTFHTKNLLFLVLFMDIRAELLPDGKRVQLPMGIPHQQRRHLHTYYRVLLLKNLTTHLDVSFLRSSTL